MSKIGGRVSEVAGVLGVNTNNLSNWLSNAHYIRKWLPIIERLTFTDVVTTLSAFIGQSKVNALLQLSDVDAILPLSRFKSKAALMQTEIVAGCKSFRLEVVQGKKNDSFLAKNAKRLATKKSVKYTDVRSFVETELGEAWKKGLPLNKATLISRMQTNFTEGAFYEKFLGPNTVNKTLNTTVGRYITDAGYSSRQCTISQKIPKNWRELAESGAARVRATMSEANVDVLISANETFLRFHEADSKVLVPTGTKHVGSALRRNEKEGCTVMVSMEMYSNRLLPSFVIFKGITGATLMKNWQEYSKSLVVYTSNHWMTTSTNILYLRHLLQLYNYEKRIGLIYDNAPSHVCKEVMAWVKKYNDSAEYKCQLIVEFIDPSLTSIYQPPDVVLNAPLKKHIRDSYTAHVDKLIKEGKIKSGDTIKVSREKLIEFVEGAYEEINRNSKRTFLIMKSFKQCGLNPNKSDEAFIRHLDKLSKEKGGEVGVYSALSDAHAKGHLALDLSKQLGM